MSDKIKKTFINLIGKCQPVLIKLARGLVVLFILANALANIIRWFDGRHVTHDMATGAGVTTIAVCLYIYFIKK